MEEKKMQVTKSTFLLRGPQILRSAVVVGTMVLSLPASGMTITGNFTANFTTNFGANAAAAQAAWNAAAAVFTSNFSDNIHITITVDAVAGTSVFGESNTSVNSFSYATLRTAVINDAKTADDATAVGAGGSVTAADPTGGTGTWWVTSAEAKALGLVGDNMNTDGITTFGAGVPFTFSGAISAGSYDFQGVAAHEIAEVMGRLGLSGGTVNGVANSYSLLDAFSFTGPGTRGLTAGPNENFSIDDGSTLLKLYNDASSNHLDTRDWGPGPNDSFNQFSNIGVVNPVSTVDLREMDVIGYDRITQTTGTPEPSTAFLLFGGLLLGGLARRRVLAQK
jgi:hypothetical protein